MFYLYRFSNRSSLNKKINWENIFDNNISIDESEINREVNINCFTLSDNDKKNGNYLSLIHSDGQNSLERIKKCFSWYREKRSDFPLYFGFCEIDKNYALECINDEDDIILFEQKGNITRQGTTHYGLFYLTEDTLDILEAKNTLISISKFFPCRKKGIEKYIGEISKSRKIETTYKLE